MINVEQNVSLASLTWWKVGGLADHLARPKSILELHQASQWAAERNLPVTVIGGASNILVSDEGVEGLVILTRDLSGIETREEQGHLKITALGGTNKAELTKIFLKYKLAPALFLCGLPGDVAGGVVMNAGVGEMIKPREFVEIVEWVDVLRGFDLQSSSAEPQLARLNRDQIQWQYRHTEGWQPGIIARVGLSWSLEPWPDIMNLVRQANKKRLQSQPLELPSCGSTFRNPEGAKAGALIDQSGLKGFQIGGAQVSEKHANFIVNRGGAKASEILQVIRHVQQIVKARHGVDLITEVKLIGRGLTTV